MTDNELKELIASLAIDTKEIKESQKKTDELQRKTDEQQKKTDEQLRQTDEQLKKTDEQLKKTDEKLARIGITVGNMSNNQGAVAEEYFVNSLRSKPVIGNLKFDIVDSNTKRHIGKLQDEFDIILINGESVAIVEVKYKVHPKDIEVLKRKLENFRKLFPVYKDFKLYAGIAGFYLPNDVLELAKSNGYFILQRKGDILETIAENLTAA